MASIRGPAAFLHAAEYKVIIVDIDQRDNCLPVQIFLFQLHLAGDINQAYSIKLLYVLIQPVFLLRLLVILNLNPVQPQEIVAAIIGNFLLFQLPAVLL
ncbi:MAG: hypothetical protein ACLR23_06775 [Clostridia bacterium]